MLKQRIQSKLFIKSIRSTELKFAQLERIINQGRLSLFWRQAYFNSTEESPNRSDLMLKTVVHLHSKLSRAFSYIPYALPDCSSWAFSFKAFNNSSYLPAIGSTLIVALRIPSKSLGACSIVSSSEKASWRSKILSR